MQSEPISHFETKIVNNYKKADHMTIQPKEFFFKRWISATFTEIDNVCLHRKTVKYSTEDINNKQYREQQQNYLTSANPAPDNW